MKEQIDLYDINGNSLNITINRGEVIPSGYYFKVVHIWILNEYKEFLIQKRAPHLKTSAGKWATTTGTVSSPIKDTKLEAYRELKEELDINSVTLKYYDTVVISNSLVDIYYATATKSLIYSTTLNEEVTDIMWASLDTINQKLNNDEFAKYSSILFQRIFELQQKIN